MATRLATVTQNKITASTSTLDFNHTTDAGTELLVLCIAVEANESLSADPLFGIQGMTLIHDTGETDAQDVRFYIYGLIAPQIGQRTFDIEANSGCNPAWCLAVNYDDVHSSVALAADFISEDINESSQVRAILPSTGITAGDFQFAVGAFQGNDGNPASMPNDLWAEVIDDVTGSSNNADFAVAFYDTTTFTDDDTSVNIDWSDSDQNTGVRIRLNPPPDVRQEHYRFCWEAGSGSGAPDSGAAHEAWTLVGSEDISYEVPFANLDEVYALIVKAGNDGGAVPLADWQLECNIDSGGWNDVNASSTGVRSAATGDTENASQSVVEQLTDTSRAFAESRLSEEDGSITRGLDFDNDEEFYFGITFRSADLSGGESILFRLTHASAAVNYDITPTATIEAASGDKTMLPGIDTLVLSGKVPTTEIIHERAPADDALVLTGHAPALRFDFVIAVPVGSLTITGHIPTTEITHVREPAIDTLVLTGRIPTMIHEDHHIRGPPVGSLVLTGRVPTAAITVRRLPADGSLVLSGKLPTVEITHTRQPDAGSLVLTGQIPSIEIIHERAPDAGSLTLTGHVPTVAITVLRLPDVGGLVITGRVPTVEITHTRLPDAGSLTLTGLIPSVEISPVMAPDAGALVLAGKIPLVVEAAGDIVRTPDAGSLALLGKIPTAAIEQIRSPPAGSLVLSGKVPSVEITHVRQPGTGSLVLTGQTPDLGGDKVPEPPVGSLTLTGRTPTTEFDWVPQPGIDALVLTGRVPSVEITHIRLPDRDQLILTGQQPVVLTGDDKIMGPNPGTLALTGLAPSVEITHVRLPDAGSLTLSGAIPSVGLTKIIPVDVGSLVLTGLVPSVDKTLLPSPASTALLLTGHAPTVVTTDIKTMAPDAGSLALTGHVPFVQAGTPATPGTDNLILTGYAPSVQITHIRQPATGSLVLTGYTTHRPEIVVPTGQLTIFTHAPIRPVGLRLTGHVPTLIIQDIGSITELPATSGLALTGHAPTIVQTGVVSTRLPDTASLSLDGEIPTIVHNIVVPPPSLQLTGYAPLVGFNILQPGAGSLVISGQLPNLINSIQSPSPQNLVLTGHAPTLVIAPGSRVMQPATGSLTITGHRPFRTTQIAGSSSARILMNFEHAASGIHLLHAGINLPLQMQASKIGEPLCFLEGHATITIKFEAGVSGAFGDLKTRTVTININGIHMTPPSLYWISDGTNLLGRATITI